MEKQVIEKLGEKTSKTVRWPCVPLCSMCLMLVLKGKLV